MNSDNEGSGGLRIAKVSGIELVLNNWFLLLMVFFAFAGFAGQVLGIFASIIFHEFAHSAAATSLGYIVKEIEVLPFGGVAKAEKLSDVSGRAEGLIAVAGPLASLGLAAVLYFWALRLPEISNTLMFYVNANLILVGFNMLPALPLDGGRITRAYLSTIWDYGRATHFVLGITKTIGIILALTILCEFIIAKRINFTFIMAAFFLLLVGFKEKCYSSFRAMRILAQKKELLAKKGIMETVYFTVLETTPAKIILPYIESDRYYVFLLVDEDCRFVGSVSERDLWDRLLTYGIYASMESFLA